MQPLFRNALLPPQHFVLGVAMEPLTLGHMWLIDRHTDILKTDAITLGSLSCAAFICCQPYESSKVNINKWWVRLLMSYWGRRMRKMDFNEECSKLCNYIADSSEQPEWKCDPKRVREMSTPWHIRVVSLLMHRLGMSLDDALKTDVLLATALLACVDECENDVQLWSDRDESLWSRAMEN